VRDSLVYTFDVTEFGIICAPSNLSACILEQVYPLLVTIYSLFVTSVNSIILFV